MTRTRTRAVCHIDDSVTRRGSLFSDPPKPDSAAEDEEDVRKGLISFYGKGGNGLFIDLMD